MLTDFFSQNQILVNLLIIAASLYLMAKAADLAVYGVSRYAKSLGLSDSIIGLLIVGVASSMPELVSSITGAAAKNSGIVLGTIFGSNIAGLALVIGISAIIHKKMSTESKVLEKTNMIVWLFIVIPFILLLDGSLSRTDGVILVILFLSYLIVLWKKEGSFGEMKKDVKLKHLWRDGIIFSGSLVVLLLSARYLVFSSIKIAESINVSSYLIALTVIALGSTMPDLMVSLKSIRQKHHAIGYGNIIGSMIIKLLLFLGVIAIINPIEFSIILLWNMMFFMTLMTTCIFIWSNKKEITKKQGIYLIIMYIIFLCIQIIMH